MLDPEKLQNGAKNLIHDIIEFLSDVCFPLNKTDLLTKEEIRLLKRNYLELHNRELASIEEITKNTGFIRYLDILYIFKFLEDAPETLLDGKFFEYKYQDLEDENFRMDVKLRFLGNISQIKWLINDLPGLNKNLIKKNKPEIIKSKFSLQELEKSRILST